MTNKRKSVTKFEYISALVSETKRLYNEGKDYNWYFEELLLVYRPLISSICGKIYNRHKLNRNAQDIRTRVEEQFFYAILKYKSSYSDPDSTSQSGKFKQVYFSTYLKGKLPWDVMRLMNPPKVEHDELAIDSRHVELDIHNNDEIVNKLSTKQSVGKVTKSISDHFISICRYCGKQLKDDISADVMMLHYGFGFKNKEIAELLGCSPQKISMVLINLNNFWKDANNLEILKDA